MASRLTQEVRVAPVEIPTTGAARVTQAARAIVADPSPVTVGGAARVTQVVRVVICTIDLSGGGLMLRGVGA